MWKPIAVITAIAAVLLATVIFWLADAPDQVNNRPAAGTPPAGAVEQPAEVDDGQAKGQAQAKPEPEPAAPKGFCERDFEQVAEREADVAELREAGGLVYIFEREARLDDPYGCADFYLDHGLDINAVDTRADGDQLTGLFYAIQRNDPKMLRFMIEHDADLQQRAGKKDTKALGYAYYLALQDQRINRNPVIGILDDTLTRQAASQ